MNETTALHLLKELVSALDEPRGTAAGGHAVIINVPGCPLMVRAVDYNALHAEKDRLIACLEKANASAEHFEREWYLRGDEIESLCAQLAEAQRDAATPTPDAFRKALRLAQRESLDRTGSGVVNWDQADAVMSDEARHLVECYIAAIDAAKDQA